MMLHADHERVVGMREARVPIPQTARFIEARTRIETTANNLCLRDEWHSGAMSTSPRPSTPPR